MNILVIEDELKTARALIKFISNVRPGVKIDGPIQRVSAAVDYLKSHASPDLIFMDIQLADGSSFEVFQKINVQSPVIFCTAYDEYALDAFKANGIDYILKPFSEESFRSAFEKLDRVTNALSGNQISPELISQILKINQQHTGKQSFLVYKNGKYTTIPTNNVAYIFARNEQTTLVTFDNDFFTLDQSLEETSGQLDTKNFFKLNRQYLLNFNAIKEVEHYFARKLLIKLTIPIEEKLLVGKDKSTLFLHWLGNR
ncbi:response regulator transcription factor [Mucilaginibacter rigui]|uniref:Response regulator transcription factor n=1 Tax=Mucilaginibacter rigui TaxID=534635 RepID=A0ABR7X992_9SPHI|nr:LytTR family DNA-binding domain-containing protein [Mucilaginibacter rigui]MBD1386705.1 response regulator transcription factor [Mucilaginibacter rigui]